MAKIKMFDEAPPLYCDYNATSPLHPAVQQGMQEVLLRRDLGNPSSVHSGGRAAKGLIEAARRSLKVSLGALDYGEQRDLSVVFCASGTEANNLVLKGKNWRRVLVSAVEHPSVLRPVEGQAELIRVDRQGLVDLEHLAALLAADKDAAAAGNAEEGAAPMLVSVMLANGETGVIQPVAAVAAVAKKYGALVHSDASQAFGKIPVDFKELGVDMLTISGHKCGGPAGVGALVLRRGLELRPVIAGGGQEEGMRSGTHNVLAIHGLGVACSRFEEMIAAWQGVARWRDELGRRLGNVTTIGRCVLAAEAGAGGGGGAGAGYLPNTLSVRMPGVRADTQVAYFDSCGICVSAGSACSAGVVGPPYVQLAMGYEATAAQEFIRISLGPEHGEEAVKRIAEAWWELKRRSNSMKYGMEPPINYNAQTNV